MRVVYVLLHEYDNGRSVETFSTREGAVRHLQALLREYAAEGAAVNVNATNGTALAEAVPGCCVEIFETEVRD